MSAVYQAVNAKVRTGKEITLAVQSFEQQPYKVPVIITESEQQPYKMPVCFEEQEVKP